MNPFPAERSILVLDNCQIHHNDELVDLVRDAGRVSPVIFIYAACYIMTY
jgi:hypothetical protein